MAECRYRRVTTQTYGMEGAVPDHRAVILIETCVAQQGHPTDHDYRGREVNESVPVEDTLPNVGLEIRVAELRQWMLILRDSVDAFKERVTGLENPPDAEPGLPEPCQPIGCDNGIHRPGCTFAEVDDPRLEWAKVHEGLLNVLMQVQQLTR